MEGHGSTLYMTYPTSRFFSPVSDGPLTPPEDAGARWAKRHCGERDRRFSDDPNTAATGLVSPPSLDTGPWISAFKLGAGKHQRRHGVEDGAWVTGPHVPGFPIPPQPGFAEQTKVSLEGGRGRPGSVLFSPDHPQSFVPGEPASSGSLPTSPTKAPCDPDPGPFIYPWNYDPFSFFSQQLLAAQAIQSPTILSPFFSPPLFDLDSMRCDTSSLVRGIPASLPYQPAQELQDFDIVEGASLDLTLDSYAALGGSPPRTPAIPQHNPPSHDNAFFIQNPGTLALPARNAESGVEGKDQAPVPPSPPLAMLPAHSGRVDATYSLASYGGGSQEGVLAWARAPAAYAWGLSGGEPASANSRWEGKYTADPESRGSNTSVSNFSGGLVTSQKHLVTPMAVMKPPSAKKKRGRLAEDVRKGVHATRLMGACIRCHIQRAKCEPNEADHNNPDAPCKTCLNVDKTSKKTIHNVPCVRFKITSIVIYRAGGLKLTERFTHTELKNIASFGTVVVRKMSQGLCREPVTIKLCQFEANDSDVLYRRYTSGGVMRKVVIPPFCLKDIGKTAKDFEQYIRRHSLDGLKVAGRDEHEIVRRTLAMISRHYEELPKDVIPGSPKVYNSQRELLAAAVNLWFAIHHGIGTAKIDAELPDMEPYPGLDESWRLSVPRMVVAQFDSIRHERIYKEYCPKVLKTYESHLTSGNREAWFTLYLVTFLFLTLVGSASRDRLRHARQVAEAQETRYGPVDHPTTRFVEELQKSGVVLLLYWTYFKRADLMKVDWDNPKRSPLVAPYQVEFMKWTVQALERSRDGIPQTPSDGCWEDSLFWISRMFLSAPSEGSVWSPPEQFERSKPSIGKE